MIAFFLSLVMVPRVKKSPEFRSRVRIIKKRKKKKILRLVKKNVVWGKLLDNKNNFLLRGHKAENKMIQRLTKREREIQKRVACRHGTDMDIYLAFEESYLAMETHTHTHTHRKEARKNILQSIADT